MLYNERLRYVIDSLRKILCHKGRFGVDEVLISSPILPRFDQDPMKAGLHGSAHIIASILDGENKKGMWKRNIIKEANNDIVKCRKKKFFIYNNQGRVKYNLKIYEENNLNRKWKKTIYNTNKRNKKKEKCKYVKKEKKRKENHEMDIKIQSSKILIVFTNESWFWFKKSL